MHKHQKMWDACFIKAWRENKTIFELYDLFKMITGDDAKEIPELVRVPNNGFPWKFKLRVFAATYMKNISDRLWAVGPEKDVDLLNKLQTTKKGVHKAFYSTSLGSLKSESAATKRNNRIANFDSMKYSGRNRDTDWSVTK